MVVSIDFVNYIFSHYKVIINEDILTVELEIKDEKIINLLNELQNKLVIDSYLKNGIEIYELTNEFIHETLSISFSKSYLKSELKYDYFETFDDFLNMNRTKLLSSYFYIADKKYSSLSSENKLQEIENYEISLKLFHVLDKIAVNKEKSGYSDYEYTIFDKRRIVIDSFYNAKSLNALFRNEKIESYIQELYLEIIGDLDRRINGIFLINAIEDIFKKEKNFKFNDFLNNFLEIYYEYQVHHRAYVNTLDLGKMKTEAEKTLKEEYSKVNDLIRDINSKIIFLPIAFIGILTQLDSSNSGSRNFFIVICMFIFALIVEKFTSMQSQILISLSEELEDNEKEYKKTEKLYKLLEGKITRVKILTKILNDRFEWTINLNWILFIIVSVLVVGYQFKVLD